MLDLIGAASGLISTVANEAADKGRDFTPESTSPPRPPTAEEIKSWTENVVADITSGAAAATEDLRKLRETTTNSQLAQLLFCQAVIRDASGGTSIRDTVNFLFRHRLLRETKIGLVTGAPVAVTAAALPPNPSPRSREGSLGRLLLESNVHVPGECMHTSARSRSSPCRTPFRKRSGSPRGRARATR